MCSKILGIGTAARNWKQMKAVKSGQRANTSTEKCKKQVLVYGRYMQAKAKARRAKLTSAGKLWDDEDFTFCKMDPLCNEIVESLRSDDLAAGGDLRIFRAWEETWEQKRIGPNGDPLHEARLLKKYGGLVWLDPDNEFSRRTAHPEHMFFEKKRGNNRYHVFAIKDGYDMKLDPQKQRDLWDVWEMSTDFYESVCDYYSDNPKVKCYTKEDDCDSE